MAKGMHVSLCVLAVCLAALEPVAGARRIGIPANGMAITSQAAAVASLRDSAAGSSGGRRALEEDNFNCLCPGSCTTLTAHHGELADGSGDPCMAYDLTGRYPNGWTCWWTIAPSGGGPINVSIGFPWFSLDPGADSVTIVSCTDKDCKNQTTIESFSANPPDPNIKLAQHVGMLSAKKESNGVGRKASSSDPVSRREAKTSLISDVAASPNTAEDAPVDNVRRPIQLKKTKTYKPREEVPLAAPPPSAEDNKFKRVQSWKRRVTTLFTESFAAKPQHNTSLTEKLRAALVPMGANAADLQQLNTVIQRLHVLEEGQEDANLDGFERVSVMLSRNNFLFTGHETAETLTTEQLHALFLYDWSEKTKEMNEKQKRRFLRHRQKQAKSLSLEDLRAWAINKARDLHRSAKIAIPLRQWNGETEDELFALRYVGFIFDDYTVQFWWYFIFSEGCKLILTSMLVFISGRSRVQMAWGFAVTLCMFIINVVWSPMREAWMNRLNNYAYLIQAVVLFFGLMIAVSDNTDQQEQGLIGSWGVLIVVLRWLVVVLPMLDWALGTVFKRISNKFMVSQGLSVEDENFDEISRRETTIASFDDTNFPGDSVRRSMPTSPVAPNSQDGQLGSPATPTVKLEPKDVTRDADPNQLTQRGRAKALEMLVEGRQNKGNLHGVPGNDQVAGPSESRFQAMLKAPPLRDSLLAVAALGVSTQEEDTERIDITVTADA